MEITNFIDYSSYLTEIIKHLEAIEKSLSDMGIFLLFILGVLVCLWFSK